MCLLTTWGPGGDRDGDMLESEIYYSFYIVPISYEGCQLVLHD